MTVKKLLSAENLGVFYREKTGLFSYNERPVLNNISFNLYEGDSVALIGKNGAGKSTLLRLLGGVIKPDSGHLNKYSTSVALLALQVGFIPEMSGRENAVMNGMLLGMRRKKIEELLPKIIAFSELDDDMDKPVNTYSTGMAARLGFSVAHFINTDVLLVDEVLAVGDEKFKTKSVAAMEKKFQSGKTIILVSHNLDQVSRLCNRAIWLDKGKIAASGNTQQVISAYQKGL